MKSIGVIGGGAAGMMAAVALKEALPECEVHLFEKNPGLGAKVLISGGGRCNVTTGFFDVKTLLQSYPRGARFLISAMHRFPPEAVMSWFESHGAPLKVEEDMRVFPLSNNGGDVVGALHNELVDDGVNIHLKAQITAVTKNGEGKFLLSAKDGTVVPVDFLIITTGGSAYQQTGSTGDGYSFARALGHTITPLGPSLNSFTVGEEWIARCAGVSLERVTFEFTAASGAHFTRTGACVFTHRGVSGPAIFALSAMSSFEKIDAAHAGKLLINLLADESTTKKHPPSKATQTAETTKRIQAVLEKNPHKKLVNFLDIFLPKSLCEHVCAQAQLSHDMLARDIRKDQRAALIEALTHFTLTVVGRAAGEEFVTAGGVSTDEVESNTMASKLCEGLYFAGEILDVDGLTGGFNLQASWATGRLAGESIARKISTLA